MDDRDISARNYCYCSRVQILACIRTEEGWEGWEGGETISSVTNLVFTPGQEGKVIRYLWHTHTHTHNALTTHTQYVDRLTCVCAGSCLRVKDKSVVDFGAYTWWPTLTLLSADCLCFDLNSIDLPLKLSSKYSCSPVNLYPTVLEFKLIYQKFLFLFFISTKMLNLAKVFMQVYESNVLIRLFTTSFYTPKHALSDNWKEQNHLLNSGSPVFLK